jgi:hypothetical protein
MQKQGQLIQAQTLKTNSETDWKNINTKFAGDTYDWRKRILKNQETLSAFDVFTKDRKYEQMGATLEKTKQETANILANTNLSEAKKAQVNQEIENLKKYLLLTNQKIITQEMENAFMKKIQAAGAIGQTAAMLIRALK